MALVKIFSGEEILAIQLQKSIEAKGIDTVLKNNSQINKLTHKNPVELFIQEVDFGKAHQIIEDFRMSL